WPRASLRPFERIMPGFWVPFRGARFHFNWRLPDLSRVDVVVLSSFSSWTGQWLMRHQLRGKRWVFWGERLRPQARGWRNAVQSNLTAPLAHASAVVGIGRAAEKDYQQRFPGLRTFCIPYHCDLSAFLAVPRPRKLSRSLTLLFCGQMIRRKGVDLLLTAFDRVVAKGLDVDLLLVGRQADLPQFLAAVSARTRARVRYEGFQPPEGLPEYFARSDAFILPSRYDGWGVVVNQALGAGLPVIASDAVGAALDLVDPEVNGLLFRAGDIDGLFRALERLARYTTLVKRWGENSRAKAVAFTPSTGAERWVNVFHTIWQSDVDGQYRAAATVHAAANS